jgi:hypothetical protein
MLVFGLINIGFFNWYKLKYLYIDISIYTNSVKYLIILSINA